MYHTITDVYTTALLLTKPSSDDDSVFRHGFGAEALLPLVESATAVSHDTTIHFQVVYTFKKNKTGHIKIIDLFPSCYGY